MCGSINKSGEQNATTLVAKFTNRADDAIGHWLDRYRSRVQDIYTEVSSSAFQVADLGSLAALRQKDSCGGSSASRRRYSVQDSE
jgi:hypothetical protein